MHTSAGNNSTERVVAYLTEELIGQGHQVTLFGTADTVTNADIIPVVRQAPGLPKKTIDPLVYHTLQMQLVMERAHEFDLLHFHNGCVHFPFSAMDNYAHITTLHGCQNNSDLLPVYSKFNTLHLVSVSDSQRLPLGPANWAGTVHYGIPETLLQQGNGEGGYLVFQGPLSPERRPDRAIEIARRAGIPIKIVGQAEEMHQAYLDEIQPLLDHPLVTLTAPVSNAEKNEFLGNALAVLMPADQPDACDLSVIEAMACGTPVIAFSNGALPELVDHRETGFIVNTISEAVRSIRQLHSFDRTHCRSVFEARFTSRRMAAAYISLYERLAEQRRKLRVITRNNRMSLGTYRLTAGI